jgi:hypothetical protein
MFRSIQQYNQGWKQKDRLSRGSQVAKVSRPRLIPERTGSSHIDLKCSTVFFSFISDFGTKEWHT